ncbi:MAG: hypothetical protein JSV54_03710 [Chloroflexota bacterium]|nr:MAG: hypothetical protein JSV54_03710 [Chloroflexota bacterium]
MDFFLKWWLRTGRCGWSRLRRWLCERRYLSIALPTVNSLTDIEDALRQVTWTMDGPLHLYDCISYPQTTWTKKQDDCDGFASLAAELLHRLNPDYNPVLLTAVLQPVQKSHTVCAFTAPHGSLFFFDNYLLRRTNCRSYDEIAAKISQQAKRLVCWDVRNPFTLELLEFHKL